jgi:hypothetical protein
MDITYCIIIIYNHRPGRIVDVHLIGSATEWLERHLRLYKGVVMLPI